MVRAGGDLSTKMDGCQRQNFTAFYEAQLDGKAYTGLLDLKPGDDFEIKLGKKQIRLIPVGAADEEE
nr:AbrB family transcriptional regulator [Synechococcus sp. J7-Johnson]